MVKTLNKGKITAVQGSVIEAQFTHDLPAIYAELKTGKDNNLIAEVQGYIDGKTVRALAMGSTQGLSRGMEITDTGHQIQVPVGPETLGRMFNVFGQPIDKKGAIKPKAWNSIHASPIPLDKRQVSQEIFVSCIKAIDLLAPMERGGKAGLFGGAGVGIQF